MAPQLHKFSVEEVLHVVHGEYKFSAIAHDPSAQRKVNDVYLLWASAGKEEEVFPRPERSPTGEANVHDSNALWHMG